MHADVKALLQRAGCKDQLLVALNSLCEPHGEVLQTLVLCQDGDPRFITCVVRMRDSEAANSVAVLCNVKTFGYCEVLFHYPVAEGFVCSGPRRLPGAACHCYGSRAESGARADSAGI